MNETEARKILKDWRQRNGSLDSLSPYIWWPHGAKYISLDGYFTPDQLKAMAWWMENL